MFAVFVLDVCCLLSMSFHCDWCDLMVGIVGFCSKPKKLGLLCISVCWMLDEISISCGRFTIYNFD